MMAQFHDFKGNGSGDIWWTDKRFYFSSIDRGISIWKQFLAIHI